VVSTTPATTTGRDATAHLRILRPPPKDPQDTVPLRFNPAELRISKSNTFADIPIPGLDAPLLQYVRGGSEVLSVDALVDTSDTLEDVYVRYVRRLRALMMIDRKEHAPPIVAFHWGSTPFVGVLESLVTTYLLFTTDGIPLRARLALTIKQYQTAAEQARENPQQSPTVEKSYVVRRGDTLPGIAHAVYRDSALWRVLAEANGIVDPRTLRPGTVLSVPRLDQGARP
jgi:hypothetical protein